MIEIAERGKGLVFSVRVTPRSSREAIEGEWQGALKIRLTSPPLGGRANEALCRLLAGRLKIPFSAVRIVGGKTSRTKRVEVSGASAEQIRSLAK